MPAVPLPKLVQTIAEDVATLPEEKQFSVMDYVMFMKQRVEDGDAAWEKIVDDPRPRLKLQAFMEAALAEGSEPLDISKF